MTDALTAPRPTRWAPCFFAIWTGQAFSLLVQFALVWWLTQTTGSATVLAMATLVAVLPGIIIGHPTKAAYVTPQEAAAAASLAE
jgi:MFS transporter, DHA3 family, macrolide efflux protein